jgi:hypothetical protein
MTGGATVVHPEPWRPLYLGQLFGSVLAAKSKRSEINKMSETQPGAQQELREVPVDWEALEDAFENNAPEVHSYLHLSTGEVLRVVDGIADPEMHVRIASDAHYLRVDPVSSREQYRWMERFIEMVEDDVLAEKLTSAIDGKGAFRRFKDALMGFSADRERWFAFRSERLRVFMEAWLESHTLRAIPRPEPKPDEVEPVVEGDPITQEALAGRRGRGVEPLRRQLKELADSLGARDLDKVLAFAEFIKARRGSRGSRSDLDTGAERSSDEVGAVAASDDP